MYPVEKKTQWKFGKFLISLQIVILLFHRASSQDWDGVIITQADFQGLQAFKSELIDPKGFLKSWNDSGFGACSGGWAGIKCAQGQVIVIQLPWKGLGGRLTDKIGQLQALRKLSLHDNMLGGSIPSTLGLLPSLRGLQLFNNRLSGPVPSSLGFCPALQTLDLSNNSLTGAIPPTLANSTRLYWLNLSFNSLSGSIPSSLAASNTLTFLSLQYNNLSGSIPDAIGSASSLRVLDLSHNSINGSIPLAICRLSSLSMLRLESNELHGQLPTDMGTSLRNLTVLDLRKNQLSGPIPGSIGKISALRSLDLSYNNLADEIPDSVAQLPSLASFNVSYNSLSGPVPLRLASRFNSSSYWGNIQLCGYSPATPCPSPASAPHHRHHQLGVKDTILIAAGSLLLLLLILCCVLGCCLLRKKGKSKEEGGDGAAEKASAGPPAAELESGGKLVHFDGPQIFTADDLLCATAEIMGKSTYGTVYKATLEDANQVAVKRLREKITRGQKEFEAEVNVLGKIRHPNLLPLRAYYLGPKGEKLLVFDYIPKGSLQTFFLHAREAEMQVNWSTRMRVIKGTTRGLIYLHNTARILHGNLTSSNILIDEDNSAKISDYGLSRLMTAGASSSVIAAAGALGYRAPELSKLKNATTKTDVYSLGVIILELLTGKSPREAMNGVDLPQWVASIVKEEWTSEVFDVELMRDASIIGDELLNTLKLALHCVDPSPSARPEAQQVLHQLEEITPEGMSSFGDEAFAGPEAQQVLHQLEEITPEGMSSSGDEAFAGPSATGMNRGLF